MKILIVDDKEENLYLLETLLKKSGHEVISAKNGVEALEELKKDSIDIIISDILMPKMDGFQLCRECKSNDTLRKIPFIFYTATYTDKKDEEFALSLGAEKFITKPTEPNVFLKILESFIKEHREGLLVAPKRPFRVKEEDTFKLYSARLIAKLEKKMLDLEREVTERKLREEKIKHLNLVLRAIRSVNQLIIRETDRDRLLLGACKSLTETRGYYNTWIALFDESGKLVTTAESGLGEDFSSIVKQLKRGKLTACGRKALKQPEIVITKNPFSTCSDCPLAVKCSGRWAMTIRLEQSGKVYGWIVTSIPAKFIANEEEQGLFKEIAGDIAFALYNMEMEAERQQTEEELRKRESILSESQRVAHIGSWELDLVSNTLTWSDETYRLFGLEPQQFEATYEAFLDNIHPDDREMVDKAYTESVRTKTPYNIVHRLLLKDGTVKYVNEKCITFFDDDGKPIRSIGTLQDITERRKAEEALHQYERIVSSSTDMLALLDKRFKYLAANKAYIGAFKFTREQVIGKTVADVFGKEFFNTVIKTNADRCMGGEEVNYQEWFNFPAYGRRYMDITYYPYYGEDNKIMGFVVNGRNITERKQAEEKLRESEERFSLFMDYFPACVFIKDQETRTLFVNKYMNDIFGAKEWLGKTVFELFPPDAAEKMMADDRITLDSGYRTSVEEVPDKNGVIHIYETYKFRLDRQNKPPLLGGIALDITERKGMEEQITRSSRLSAMGEMIGGVAHELNNPLTSVLGNTQWLLTSKVDPKMLEETLQKIERSAQKCRDIVADLLEFTREKAYKFELADINDVVRRTLEMFQKQADISHIEIRTNYKKNLPLVNISASHIEQIFLNTMTNALHAMPEGGNLTVNTCLEEDTIQVKFQDTGVGIETEDLDKIFNPFYTKKVGSTVTGTGLGLSMAHKIIDKHKGTITAQSEGKGKGATFTVTLPVDKEGKSRK